MRLLRVIGDFFAVAKYTDGGRCGPGSGLGEALIGHLEAEIAAVSGQ